MLRRDDNGRVFAHMACPHCDHIDDHAQIDAGDDEHFRCAQCFAGFTHNA